MTAITIDQLQLGDIVLTADKEMPALTSLFIRFVNFCKYGYGRHIWTHSAIYAGDGMLVEAQPSGIRECGLAETYLNGRYDVLVLRRKPTDSHRQRMAVNYCLSCLNSKYDFRALIYFLLTAFTPFFLTFLIDNEHVDRMLNTENAWFCSELVGTGLLESGQYCFDREPFKSCLRIMPTVCALIGLMIFLRLFQNGNRCALLRFTL